MSMNTGMIIVIFISMMYLPIVFVLILYVGNKWCDLLYKISPDYKSCLRPFPYLSYLGSNTTKTT
jgi:hypothetical protein